LFLVYGAPHEDWSWCFYEVGYFAALIQPQSAKTIFCLVRPDMETPGPLKHLQSVTRKDELEAPD
jgi:hypothetical protein